MAIQIKAAFNLDCEATALRTLLHFVRNDGQGSLMSALYPLHLASQWGDGLSADHLSTENSLSQAQKHPEGFSLIYLIAQTLARVQASVSFPIWTIPFTSTLPGRVVFRVLIASPFSALMRKTPSLAGVRSLVALGLTLLSLRTKVFLRAWL